jgi:ADP-ribose pyrophosphatase
MTETLLTTPKFVVERRQVRLQDGRLVAREVIVHPGAVVILPILADGSIVMIRNYRFAAEDTLLELPAGTLEAGEDPRYAAARELEEETGYRAEQVEPLCEFYTSPGILSERMRAYLATGLSEVGQNLDDTEEIEVEIMRPDKIRQLIIDGQLTDGKTIAVLGTYMLRDELHQGSDGTGGDG